MLFSPRSDRRGGPAGMIARRAPVPIILGDGGLHVGFLGLLGFEITEGSAPRPGLYGSGAWN